MKKDSGKDSGILRETVIGFSESDFWEEAVTEWEIVDCEIDDTMKSNCICGQEGLKYCFVIRNKLNHNTLCPIGSSCINQFGRGDLRQVVTLYEQLFSIRENTIRGRESSLGISQGTY